MRRAYCCKIYSSMGLTRMPSLVDEMPLWHHQKGVEVFWHMNPECLHHRMSQGEVYKEKQRTSSKRMQKAQDRPTCRTQALLPPNAHIDKHTHKQSRIRIN